MPGDDALMTTAPVGETHRRWVLPVTVIVQPACMAARASGRSFRGIRIGQTASSAGSGELSRRGPVMARVVSWRQRVSQSRSESGATAVVGISGFGAVWRRCAVSKRTPVSL